MNFVSVHKFLFILIVIAILFEGFARKIIPAVGVKVFLFKDVLIILSFILLLPKMKVTLGFQFWHAIAVVYFLVFFISFFSLVFSDINLYLYFLGFREYFFYAALLPITSVFFEYYNINRFIKIMIYVGVVIDLLGILQSLQILQLDSLTVIADSNQEHSSFAGVFYFTVSIFDVPEKFAIFNVFLFFLIYSSISTEGNALTKHDFMFLTIFLIAIIISGRRVAIFLAVLLVVFNVILKTRSINSVIKVMSVLVISPFVAYGAISVIDPVLAEIIFSSNTTNDAILYLKWATGLFVHAIQQVDYFYGYFGLTSPGSDVIPEKSSLIYYEIEGFWDKSLFALGVVGTVLLFISFVMLLMLIYVCSLKFNHDYLLMAISYYMLVVFFWGIKSGNFMVWAPFTFIMIAIFFVRFGLNRYVLYGVETK